MCGFFVCLFVFFVCVVLPVDTPGPVHQIAELRSLVFGLENKELILNTAKTLIETFVHLLFISFVLSRDLTCSKEDGD